MRLPGEYRSVDVWDRSRVSAAGHGSVVSVCCVLLALLSADSLKGICRLRRPTHSRAD